MELINVYLDLEFTGLHQKTTPISLGLVTDNDCSFYAEFSDYDRLQMNPWIEENVISGLTLFGENTFEGNESRMKVRGNTEYIRKHLEAWFQQILRIGKMDKNKPGIQIISDCLAYDWVLFCELWDGALNVPPYIYYIPLDLSTALHIKGFDPDIEREKFAMIRGTDNKHNALWDAHVIKACWTRLMDGVGKSIL